MSEPFAPQEIAPGVWRAGRQLSPDTPLFLHVVRGAAGALVLDTGLAGDEALVHALLDAAGARPRDVRVLVNTHAHHDHIGSNRAVAEATGALVAAPHGAVPWIEDHARHVREFVLHHPHLIADAQREADEIAATLDGPTPVALHLAEGSRLALGDGLELEAVELPGHLPAEIGLLDRRSGTLLLGDAVTGIDWALLHGHASPALYRRTLHKLRELVGRAGIRRVAMAHFELMDPTAFVDLLDRAEAYVARLDGIATGHVRARGEATLEQVWHATCEAMGKQHEFRSLATVDAHLREAVADGRLRAVGEDRYAPAA